MVSAEISKALIIEILLDLRMLKEFVKRDKSESISEFFKTGITRKNLSSLLLNLSKPTALILKYPVIPIRKITE